MNRSLVRSVTAGAVLLLVVLWFALLGPPSVGPGTTGAAGFTVNDTADASDANPGDGVCATSGGVCTLQAAVGEANALSGADVITLPAGTYITSLTIKGDITLNGAGAATTIVDGGAQSAVFWVSAGATVEISDLTIRNGSSPSYAGIYNGGELTLNRTVVRDNWADNASGGIHNSGTLTLNQSTVRDNWAGNAAAGIGNGGGGVLTINDSTISGNSALAAGGIGNNGGGVVTINNSTISGNGPGTGGGVHNATDGVVIINNTTITNNATGGIYNGGTMTLKNTIVASNNGPECYNSVTSAGHNLASDTSCGFMGTGDLSNANPLLGPLADNGGLTLTHALQTGSPAIDTASSDCPPPGADQRGVLRPAGACDIGAFELCPISGCPTLTPTPTLTPCSGPCPTAAATPTATITPTPCPSEGCPTPTPPASTNSITTPDSAGNTGLITWLVLDAAGNPVVNYWDFTQDSMKVLHCDDPNCAGGGESITMPVPPFGVGSISSMVLDHAGNPVVAFHLFDRDLRVLHCNDPNCAGGGDSTTTPPGGADVAGMTSLALDAAGNPVVSFGTRAGTIKVLHCNDPNCAGGGESITTTDAAGTVGGLVSMALDTAGKPVVSYWGYTNSSLKLLHCGDPNCSAGNTIAVPDTLGGETKHSGFTSLALDASGNPIVAYYDTNNRHLKVLHCNDPGCVGGNESIAAVDTTSNTGTWNSMALDSAGNPVVSYCLAPSGNPHSNICNAMRVLHCGNPDCSAGNTIVSPDVGSHSSLVLDTSGNPVVSYYDDTNSALKVLHCGTPTCIGLPPTPTPTPTPSPTPGPDTDGDGCADNRENGNDPTKGGLRNPADPWDFYDVSGMGNGPPDGVVDLANDILGVILHYAPQGKTPPYDIRYDRGPQVGPNPWNLGAADGVIDLANDILGVIQQYLHNCQ